MSLQNTFRDVAKPKVNTYSATLAGGVLDLDEGTNLVFSGDAVGSITSLSGHEYLVDGQPIYLVNSHGTATLSFSIGSFSATIPAGYGDVFFFDEGNTSFTRADNAGYKVVRDDIVTNAGAISAEAVARAADTLLNYRLDGSRALTGNMDVNSNFLNNVPTGTNSDHVVNLGQMDAAVATLEAAISASSTSLAWRSPADVATEFTTGSIPANGDALVDSNFGAGNNRLFEDDDAATQFTVANFPADDTVVFLKAASEPKLMVCRDVLGTKRWYDSSESDVALKIDRTIVAGDTFIVKNDLLDTPDAHENTAIYHIVAGTPKTAIKIGDIDWDQATGISISVSYTQGAGGATVVTGDSVEQALQKLDGNIEKNRTDAATALTNAIAQEVSDRNDAIDAESVILSAEIDSDITASQNAQNAILASTSSSEGASLLGIEDAGAIISATTVEGALAENRGKIDTNESDITGLQSDVSSNTTNIGINTTDIGINATAISTLESDLASNANGEGASKIGIEDLNGDFTATTVEGALAELDEKVDNLNLVNHLRGLHEAAATGATTLDVTTDFVDILGGGGSVQDLSSASYINCFINRDGAMLIGGVGYTLSGSTLTLTAAGGGELIAGEVVELRVIQVS